MATTSEASRLQKMGNVMRFTWITVGLLAGLSFASCGVGVDDPVGQQAATGTSEQALVGLEGTPAGDPNDGAVGPAPSNPTVSSLPSDPIPVHGIPDSLQVIDPMTGLPVVAGAPTAGK